jgi:hypothetical protein
LSIARQPNVTDADHALGLGGADPAESTAFKLSAAGV